MSLKGKSSETLIFSHLPANTITIISCGVHGRIPNNISMKCTVLCGKTTLSKHDKGIYSNVLNLFSYLLHATNCCKS